MDQPCFSSGLKTSDGIIAARPCRLIGVTIIAGSDLGAVIVYDNASAASGNVVAKITAVTTATQTIVFNCGVECLNGLYADVSGTSAGYIVHYQLM